MNTPQNTNTPQSLSQDGALPPAPSPHAKPKRRSFTAQYKLDVLEMTDRATGPGAIGLILRQEGLYSSHLTEWRRWRDRINRGEPATPKRPDGVGRAEFEKVQRENARLRKKLEQAQMMIELQKKLNQAMESLSDGSTP